MSVLPESVALAYTRLSGNELILTDDGGVKQVCKFLRIPQNSSLTTIMKAMVSCEVADSTLTKHAASSENTLTRPKTSGPEVALSDSHNVFGILRIIRATEMDNPLGAGSVTNSHAVNFGKDIQRELMYQLNQFFETFGGPKGRLVTIEMLAVFLPDLFNWNWDMIRFNGDKDIYTKSVVYCELIKRLHAARHFGR